MIETMMRHRGTPNNQQNTHGSSKLFSSAVHTLFLPLLDTTPQRSCTEDTSNDVSDPSNFRSKGTSKPLLEKTPTSLIDTPGTLDSVQIEYIPLQDSITKNDLSYGDYFPTTTQASVHLPSAEPSEVNLYPTSSDTEEETSSETVLETENLRWDEGVDSSSNCVPEKFETISSGDPLGSHITKEEKTPNANTTSLPQPVARAVNRGRFLVTVVDDSSCPVSSRESVPTNKKGVIAQIHNQEDPAASTSETLHSDDCQQSTNETEKVSPAPPLKSILRHRSQSYDDSEEPSSWKDSEINPLEEKDETETPKKAALPFAAHELNMILANPKPLAKSTRKSVRFTVPTRNSNRLKLEEADNANTMTTEGKNLLDQVNTAPKEANGRNSNGSVKLSSNGSKVQLSDTDLHDTLCGLGSCTPGWVQFLARKETYVFLYCMGGLTIGTFFTYSVAVISTIEKRFGFTSKTTGMILSGNDISQVMLAILIAYFGNYGHRPRWIAFGLFSAAISCLIAGSPHFLYGPGEDAEFYGRISENIQERNASLISGSTDKDGLCYASSTVDCSETQGDTSDIYVGPAVMLFISQFFVGITISIYYSIGFTYLDDNIDKKEMPLYYSISMILRVVGPVLGYFMGSRCLMLWVDPSKEPNLSSRDPRWIGAWWLGYMSLGVVLLVVSAFFLFFPRRLPEKAKHVTQGVSKGTTDPVASLSRSPDTSHETPTLEKLPGAMKRLFTNKIWVGSLFNTLFYLTGLVGYWNFKPKYLENQFRKSASEANFYTGLASLLASILGLGASGAILRWLRPGPRFVSGYAIFLTLFSTASMVLLMFIGCPKIDIRGPMIGKAGWKNSLSIWNSSTSPLDSNETTLEPCWADCGCVDRFVPVCSKDGSTTFYSPCYAGCTSVNTSASPKEYTNCKCISNGTDSTTSPTTEEIATSPTGILEALGVGEDRGDPGEGQWGSATRGFCQEECEAFVYYLLIQIITKMVGSTGRVGGTLLHLRSVAEEDKALALGTFMVFLSLFSFIPAPIIMGAIVDSACLVWEEKCGRRGNCWFYDSDHFRVILHAVPAILIFISVLGDLIVFHYCKKLKLYGEEDEEQMKEKEVDPNELQPINERRTANTSIIRI